MKKLTKRLIITASLLVITSTPILATVPRLMIETDNYKLAKYEPTKGAYLGAYVVQDTLIDGDMNKFNEMTGKKHASFFRYVGYGTAFPEKWFAEVREAGASAHVAWEPNGGLDEVKDNEYLRTFAKELGKSNTPVFLRFASEMNGTWTAYSEDPVKYKEKWKIIHKVMKEEAPNVMMTWTVFTNPISTITKFYPGDAYVDWVGVNIYNVIYHNNSLKEYCEHEDPLELLDYVYDTFSDRKPIQISEYGATHYTITDGKEYFEFAQNKIRRMYNGIADRYPRVKSIFYFNVNNLINAPEGRKINNYAINDNNEILYTYSTAISNPHFLSEVSENREGTNNKEMHNVKDGTMKINGTLFISASSIREYFDAEVHYEKNKKTVTVYKGDNSLTLKVNRQAKPDVAIVRNSSTYLPIREVVNGLGYTISVENNGNLIKVNMEE